MSTIAAKDVPKRVDDAYRSESRRVFATLVRLLGDFDLAVEALQDAFASAVEQWARDGVPANPRAWLVANYVQASVDIVPPGIKVFGEVIGILNVYQLHGKSHRIPAARVWQISKRVAHLCRKFVRICSSSPQARIYLGPWSMGDAVTDALVRRIEPQLKDFFSESVNWACREDVRVRLPCRHS